MSVLPQFKLKERLRATALHLVVSLVVASIAAGLVFGLWFPGIYRELAGGIKLFLLLAGVDVVLGPLLTFAVFDRSKGWPHLRRDLATIGMIQLSALVYGLHEVSLARPVATVFEVDRFRIVTANQVYDKELSQADPSYRKLPWQGPWLLGTRRAKSATESEQALALSIQGVDIGQRPSFWQSYESSRSDVLAHAKPISVLLTKYPSRAAEIGEALHRAGLDEKNAQYVPLMARDGDWVSILNSAGEPRTFFPIDGFV